MLAGKMKIDKAMSAAGIKGKRGHSAVLPAKWRFGLLQTAVYCRIIRENIKPDCMIDADRYHSYNETDACAFGHCSSQKHRSLEKLRCRTNHNTHFAER